MAIAFRNTLLVLACCALSACSIPRLSETGVLKGEGVQFDPERNVFVVQYIDPGLIYAPSGTTAENLHLEGIGNPKSRIEQLFFNRGIDLPGVMQPLVTARVRELVSITTDTNRPFIYLKVTFGFQKYSPLPSDVRPFVMIEPIVQRGLGGEHLWRSISISGNYKQAIGSRRLSEWLEADKEDLVKAFEPAITAAIRDLQLLF